jgi:hypothetical protein
LFSLGRQTLSVTRLALLPRDDRVAWVRNWLAMETAIARGRPGEAEAAMRKLVETVGASAMRVLKNQKRAPGSEQARDG